VKDIKKPEDYPYSSYEAYRRSKKDDLVSKEVLLELFGGGKDKAMGQYRTFVEAGMEEDLENPEKKIYGGMILGGTQFIKEALRRLKSEYIGKREISHRRSLKSAEMADEIMNAVAGGYETSVEEITEGRDREMRNVAIYLLKKHTGMANRDIGERCGGLTYSAVTKACRKLEGQMGKIRSLRTSVGRIERKLSQFKG
jgi:hypothetical protein